METKQQLESQELDQQQRSHLSSSDLRLVPFVPKGKVWNASDTFLASLYQKTEGQGLVKTVFFEGSVGSYQDFIAMAKRRSTVMVFTFRDETCVGYAWLAPITGNYAFPHFCFFKDVWGEKSRELGSLVLDYWFSWQGEHGALLDVLIGVIPDFNIRAHRFVEDIGAVKLGTVPRFFRDREGIRRDGKIYYWTPRVNNGQTKRTE